MRATILSCACLAGACGDVDPAPSVVVLEASPDRLDPADDARDDLTIRIAYEDGDADLGGGVALVHDCRADELVTALAIPPIASDEAIAAKVPIRGELLLTVADVGDVAPAAAAPAACAELGVPAPSAGAAIFCVVLRDAAGHEGPGDCTDPIAIAAP